MNISMLQRYKNIDRVLDIGANVGQFYKECKLSFPNSYIFSIEATKECEDILKEINPNYLIKVLYKEKTNLPFYKRKNDLICTGNSLYKENTEFYNNENSVVEYIETEMLDNIFTEDSIFDLIKIDTQGSELDIISGGINLCKKAKLILLEVSLIEYNENQPLLNEVNEYMNNIGFEQVDVIGENYHPITKELIQYDILYKNTFN
jgi:FkbM family methyltransferase